MARLNRWSFPERLLAAEEGSSRCIDRHVGQNALLLASLFALSACGDVDSISVPKLDDEAAHQEVMRQLVEHDRKGIPPGEKWQQTKSSRYDLWRSTERRIRAGQEPDFTPDLPYASTVGEALDQWETQRSFLSNFEKQLHERNASIAEREAAYTELYRRYGFKRPNACDTLEGGC